VTAHAGNLLNGITFVRVVTPIMYSMGKSDIWSYF